MNAEQRAKLALREKIKEKIRELKAPKLKSAGMRIAEHLELWLSSQINIKNVALFQSFKDEIDTSALASMLQKNGFSLWWDLDCDILKLDIIFVPGLAFSQSGQRLGRGQGYYDRYLSGLDHKAKRPILIGLCLDEQLVEDVPIEEHDIIMDFICTPSFGVL